MNVLVNLYVFKENSTFYTNDSIYLKFDSPFSMYDIKDYFTNNFEKYKGMHLVVIPEENSEKISDSYPVLILNGDRKYDV